MSTDPFWATVNAQLDRIEAEKPDTFEKVAAILEPIIHQGAIYGGEGSHDLEPYLRTYNGAGSKRISAKYAIQTPDRYENNFGEVVVTVHAPRRAFFSGSGCDRSLYSALHKAGWRIIWSEAHYYYVAEHAATGSTLTYIEGDVLWGISDERRHGGGNPPRPPQPQLDAGRRARFGRGACPIRGGALHDDPNGDGTMTQFKSRQVNLDPEPWVDQYGTRWETGRADPLSTYRPRPEFEPTRDPGPWLDALGTRWAFQPPEGWTAEWSPRREQFDTPVNPILVAFRREVAFERAVDLPHAGESFLISLRDEREGVATPEQVDHARRVLTRLANRKEG